MGVNAVGAATYNWYFNSASNYSGATLLADGAKYTGSATFNMTITNLADSDSGYYYAVVGNGSGSVTSILATLKVYNEPLITSQTPAGGALRLFQNQSYALSVAAAFGETNYSYQWFTNSTADTTAGTGSTYQLASVQAAMSGNTYKCVVTNPAGSATNSLVTLTVLSLPASITNSPYATNLLALNPTVYFPMHETAPATAADTETNYGTLGAVANGTYADWDVNGGAPGNRCIYHGFGGALAGDPDSATFFDFNGNTNSYLYVPHTSPQTTLTPPFTIECWVWAATGTFGDLVSQDGTKLNTGNANNSYGVRLSFGNNTSPANTTNIQVLVGSGTSMISYPTSGSLSLLKWHHVALTTDGTNWDLYVDGYPAGTAVHAFIPDSWDPLTIGAGLWNNTGVQRICSGIAMDEVAIYATNLDGGTIYTHYNDGVSGSPGQYYSDVTSLNPIMYYRMDGSVYTQPNSSTWLVMTNYGTVAVNGVYTPGTAPGGVARPNNGAGAIDSALSGTGAASCNGMSTFAEAYSPSAFDPAGQGTPFTVSMWFKGNPSDSRYESLISEGTGWQINQQQNGTLQFYLTSFMNSKGVYNDGNWHQVAVTFSTNVYSTNVLTMYVDGQLDNMATNSAYTNPPPDTVDYTGIGADMRYTGPSWSAGVRQYAGNICEVAFWNGTALTSNQVAALYAKSGMPPVITSQPVSASLNAGSAFTNKVAASGPGSLVYQWYRDGQPLPIGGQMNLASGATNASLAINPVQPSDASLDYYVVITNSGGAVTSSVVSLTVNTSPVFTNEPILVTYTNNILLFAGAAPTFKVGSVGAQPTYYRWFTNGVAATTNGTALTSYTLPTVQLVGGVTNFYCVASNLVNMVTNTPVSVTVIAAPTAPYPAAVLAANPMGFWLLNESNVDNYNDGAAADDYWGGANGIYTNTVLGQPGYSAATDPNQPSAEFGYDTFWDDDAYGIGGIDFASPSNSSPAFSVEAWVTGYPQTKDGAIVSKGYGNGGEEFVLDTGSDNAPTSHGFRFFVRDAAGTVHSAVSTITMVSGTWNHLVGVCDEANSNVTLYVNGVVAGKAAIAPGSGILTSARQMIIGSRPSNATTNANDLGFVGSVDDVAVYNYALSAGQVGTQYAQAGVAPTFSQPPPSSLTANGFATLVIPVSAVGTPPIGYTWSDVGGGTNLLAGSTNGPLLNATLTIGSVPLAWNNDTLQLTVTNAYGSTNVTITLTVLTNAPQVTLDLPPQVTILSGKPYTYSIGVAGPQPYSYQWYNGASLIAGQTGSTYTLTAGSPGSTTYYVVITNVFGASTSSVSTFTSVAQLTNSYAATILGLKPVGYWPLQETNAPAPVTMETNYGLLGQLGTAYYVGTNASSLATFGQGGALSGDSDKSVVFNCYSAANGQGYVAVPGVSPALTLNPPFTLECWANPGADTTAFGDILGNRGTALNNATAGVLTGTSIQWEHSPSQFSFYAGSGTGQTEVREVDTISPGGWHHVVLTCDVNTNFTLYVDGVSEVSRYLPYVPSLWNPLTIGAGFWDWTEGRLTLSRLHWRGGRSGDL